MSHLSHDILLYIFAFLHPDEYMFLNKLFYRHVLNNRRKNVEKISNWFLKNKASQDFSFITPKIFIIHYSRFCIKRIQKNRRKCPELVTSLLNLNRHSLNTLPSYNERTIQDIMIWLKQQKLSQYEYKSLLF